MGTSQVIFEKLEAFIRKYYTNELIRGSIFFFGIGLMYFLFTLSVEYFLWLKPSFRTILFWTFIAVELFLLTRFVLFPIFKLFRLQKGIDYNQASKIIGSHFSEVQDKLTNFLQLSKDDQSSELLLASIDQKADDLKVVPFTNAVNFSANKKYLPIALLPIVFLVLVWLSGNNEFLSQSLNRVVNYQSQFTPPAPFELKILNKDLQVEKNQDFILKVKAFGKMIPENAFIQIGEERYFMESVGVGTFQYVFAKPDSSTEFFIQANEVRSEDLKLDVIAVPSIENFKMQLHYPAYLNRKPEVINGSGNAIVPEGTRVTWNIQANSTKDIFWKDAANEFRFQGNGSQFSLSKVLVNPTEYEIKTSNDKVKDYEKLNYRLSVIKDQFPSIIVNHAPDSLKVDKRFVLGQVSDDYGLSKLQITYYPAEHPNLSKKAVIPVKKDVYDQFVFAFPSNLPVDEGVNYEYYFEVFDNDAANGFKSSKSAVFSNRIQTEQEKKDDQLMEQNSNINSLSKSLKNQEKQMSELDKLQRTGKEKESLEYKDRQKLNEFIKRQQEQDKMMKEFSKKLEENLQKFNPEKKDEVKEELERRLEKSQEEIEKNQKLLEELQKLNDKINKEELFQKMDQFKQEAKNQVKNLEQLVELTKRYYVEKKAEQIADKLQKLGDKQEELSKKDKENTSESQKQINEEFDAIKKELDQLEKENKELKAPLDLPETDGEEKSIEDDLKKASEELQKKDSGKAKPKQKSAAQKMKEMGGKMTQSMDTGEMEQMDEDTKMLRQILDNLLAFSFKEENLMQDFKQLKRSSPSFGKNLKTQQDLRVQFKHVDDSLFAMSMRNPRLKENIHEEIGKVHYNMDKALETLAEAQVSRGVAHQQYVISSANKLADMLSSIMNDMQMEMQMSSSGKGKPKPSKGQGDMQLPDIIQKQQQLGQKMKDGMKEGDKPGEKPGEKPGQGQQQSGQSGKDGKDGKNGKNNGGGNSGKGNSDGKQNGQGDDGEGDAEQIMQIYKEQRQLREALERELKNKGLGGSGQNAINQMKSIEKQLLNKGFNNEVLQKTLNLKYELLKLEKAVQQQGEEQKRQSEANKKDFQNNTNALPESLKDYLNSIEILNRQALPLRSNYNQKVQEYFKSND